MPISRSSILAGPGVIQYDGLTIVTKGDIEISLGLETFNIETSLHGAVDQRRSERFARVTFEPAGDIVDQTQINKLFSYLGMTIGQSIFGATDKPLVCIGADLKRVTLAAAAITRIPDVRLGAMQTFAGQVEFTGTTANNTAWTGANSLLTVDTAGEFPELTFDPDNVLTQKYTGAWGASPPWNSIETEEGWTISQNLQTFPIPIDGEGVVDIRFQSLDVTARARPVGPTEAEVLAALALQGSGATRGGSLGEGQSDLVLSATGFSVTVKQAALREAGYHFDHRQQRIRQCEWIATRKLTGGALDPLLVLTVG